MEKAIIHVKEIFNQIGTLELEEKKIQDQSRELKAKYGIKKTDRLYAYGDFSKVVQKIYHGSKLDRSLIESLFTEMLSEPSNIMLTIKYITTTTDGDKCATRIAAFKNVMNYPDLAIDIIGRFTIGELEQLVNMFQDYWMHKYQDEPLILFNTFIYGAQFLKPENLMKLIVTLGDKRKINELKRIKATEFVKGECLEKLDSYLVLETLIKGSV